MPTDDGKNDERGICVSRTTVLKRTIDRAPTRLNARATLSPITCVTIAIRIDRSTRVIDSDDDVSLAGRVR